MNYAVENVSLLEKDVDMEKVFEKRSIIYIFIKRMFDIICALIGLIFMLPIALVVKIMYICSGDFNSIFYIIPRVIVNYRTTFPGISLLIFLFHPLLKASLVAQSSLV